MKINMIYWSGTGNTEQMAKLIQEGAKGAGAEIASKQVLAASADDVSSCDVLVLGCSSMGDEVLEENDFEPYMVAIEGAISGKKIALFGSYGWGDGQWMRDWDVRIKNAGATLVAESLIINEYPDGDDENKCRDFGKSIAAS